MGIRCLGVLRSLTDLVFDLGKARVSDYKPKAPGCTIRMFTQNSNSSTYNFVLIKQVRVEPHTISTSSLGFPGRNF